MVSNQILDDFKGVLSKEGMKYTQTRYDVLSYMIDMNDHQTCEDIYNNLKSSGKDVSKATVYRTLDILVKYDFVRKMDIGDGMLRYEKKIGTPHHDHMICIESGDIIEFCSDQIERIQDSIAKRNGYEVVRHVHHLFVKPIKGSGAKK